MATRLVQSWRRCPSLLLSCPARRRNQRPEPKADPDPDAPIPFRSSCASPRAWSVVQSTGDGKQRLAWQLLALGCGISALLLWSVLQEEPAPGPGEALDGSEDARPTPEAAAAAAASGSSAGQPG